MWVTVRAARLRSWSGCAAELGGWAAVRRAGLVLPTPHMPTRELSGVSIVALALEGVISVVVPAGLSYVEGAQ